MSYIENEAAYERAKEARIHQNRRIGGERKWHAREGKEECERLRHWLFGAGEFDYVNSRDPACQDVEIPAWGGGTETVTDHVEDCSCSVEPHPMTWYCRGDFYNSMRDAIDEWGGLTEGQHAAVKRGFKKAQKKLAERDANLARKREADLEKGWVGEVKERRDFECKIEKRFDFSGQYGMTFIHIMRDADENIIVYKGSVPLGKRGDDVAFKATVKAHEVREDIKQTIVARPKIAE